MWHPNRTGITRKGKPKSAAETHQIATRGSKLHTNALTFFWSHKSQMRVHYHHPFWKSFCLCQHLVLWLNPFYYPIVNNWQKWAEFVRTYQVGLEKYILDPEKHQNVMLKKTLEKNKLKLKTFRKRNFSYFTQSKAYFLISDQKQELYTYLDILDQKGIICQGAA